ncbi:unnamed protein product [Cylindrotheca closterium]|uniref:Metallo-beta-lactamase domain-containing protein n=1 Tax=Cylindrotheca closterium TaxID=2856 RepID=A0AAD2FUD5_9STRA|nr:unnamed protein product [Cylindrotheca closterium]
MTDKNDELYDDSFYIGRWFREMRHSKILMTPVALLFFTLFGVVALFNLVMSFPGVILGLILAPILRRNAFYIEFLYPWAVAKWGHFFLVNRGANNQFKKSDKNRGFHSRTIEQRVEVVPGRVYIHPIPQFGDNLGYLVVCLPAASGDKIIAFMVDCGQADSVVRAIELIQEFHYRKKKIEIQSILCTHKHHDHTGGTLNLMKHKSDMGKTITRVFGGVVERVPECTDFVANGDILELPKSEFNNNMNLLVEVEVIAVPAHTRGSVVFRLRPKVSGTSEFLFMGDAMFSGGAGVPFEADVGQETEKQLNKANGNSFFKGGIGPVAVERCFSEILSRSMPDDNSMESMERILIFTGHEYTSELLARQFNAQMESCRWRLFSPKDFFETAAQLYTAIHRRSLPHNTGKLLNIPSPLSRELYINPNFRSMKRSAEFVIRAINFWYDNFCKFKASPALHDQKKEKKNQKRKKSQKTPSQTKSWTLDAENYSHNAFTTVYTEDLEDLIKNIEAGKVGRKEGAAKLREITRKLGDPAVNKRPIPGFLPSNKNIWRGVSGLARLGSKPSGMTLSDSQKMKTAPPIDSNSDRILVSLQRLLLVLGRLGFLQTDEGMDITYRVKQLFREASVIMKQEFDAEMDETQDEIELGVLKWMLYGVEPTQPSCLAKTCCMPFSSNKATQREFPQHPAVHFKKKVGELVSHDIYTCKICRHATGCFDVSSVDNPDEKPVESDDELPSDEFGLEIPLDEVEPSTKEPDGPKNTKSSEWNDETRTDSDSRSQSEMQQRLGGVEVQGSSVNGVESVEVETLDGKPKGQDSLLSQQQKDEEELSELVSQLTISVGVDGEEDTEISLDGRRQ